MLCRDMAPAYNDIAAWNYAELPHALGCQGWFTARVSSCGVLDDASKTAEAPRCTKSCTSTSRRSTTSTRPPVSPTRKRQETGYHRGGGQNGYSCSMRWIKAIDDTGGVSR